MCVTHSDYRDALASAIAEYESLGEKRREIDDRLAQLAQTIGTLSRLIGLTPTVPLGLTDACRLALRTGLPMTPMEVRDRLLAIHTVLKRLNEAGEARFIPRGPGKDAYLWARPASAMVLGPEIAEFMRGSGRQITPKELAAAKRQQARRRRSPK
jgi:hypothetical protein